MAVFCPERKFELTDEEKKPRKERKKKTVYGSKAPIQGLAVTPSGEGRGNGKKTYMGVGGAAREWAKGMRDGMKFLVFIKR
jgi:hypothetical protein